MSAFRPGRRLPVLFLAGILLAAAGCEHMNLNPTRMRQESESHPLGEVQELSANILLHAGQLTLDQADPGQLYAVDTEWDAANQSRKVQCDVAGTSAVLNVAIEGSTTTDQTRIRLSLSDRAELDLSLQTGAGENKVDLSGLNLRQLDLKQGAGSVDLRADSPQAPDCREIVFQCGVGETHLRGLANLAPERIDFKGGIGHAVLEFSGHGARNMKANLAVGIGQVDVIVPRSLGVRLEMQGNTSNVSIPSKGFRKIGSTYTSEGYAETDQRLDVTVAAGLGGVSIRYLD
jgi:hypothetical protein